MPPSLSELVGGLKTQSDLSSQNIRIRYTESTSVTGGAGKKIMLRFPKIPGKFLNMASLKLHFTLATSGDSYMDVFDYSSLFQRVRVLSSSNVIMDITEYGTLATTLRHSHTNVNYDNLQTRLNHGTFNSAQQAKRVGTDTASVRACVGFPQGTFLNCDALLPVDRLNGFVTLELYLANPLLVLKSDTNDLTVNYSMSDIQLICDYISSPTLSSYFDSSGVSYHIDNFSHRFQNLNDQKNVLRLPSAFTSLSKLLVLIRDQSRVDSTASTNVQDRQQRFLNFSDIQEIQFYSNNVPLWSEPIILDNITTELWEETLKAFPQIEHSTFHNSTGGGFQVGGAPIGISLMSAPKKFHEELLSGIKSAAHVSDLYAHITYKSGTTFSNNAATVFLMNESRIFVDSNGALQIEY